MPSLQEELYNKRRKRFYKLINKPNFIKNLILHSSGLKGYSIGDKFRYIKKVDIGKWLVKDSLGRVITIEHSLFNLMYIEGTDNPILELHHVGD